MSKIEYPCLMEGACSRLVVCFSSERKGHVVIGDELHREGHYSELWTPSADTDLWKPYMPPLYEDGEICWVWDRGGDNIPALRRYDAKNKCWCYRSGVRKGKAWENHAKFEGTLPFELPKIKD